MARRSVFSIITVSALLTGCAVDARGADPPTVPTDVPSMGVPSTGVPATTAAPSKGWIDGEPAWHDGAAGVSTGGAVLESAATAAMDASPSPVLPPSSVDGSLRAGSVDDNADFDAYLEYLTRLKGLEIGRAHV